jgi:hypothetical protein
MAAHTALILRSALSRARLEGWPQAPRPLPILRDAAKRPLLRMRVENAATVWDDDGL